MSESRNYPYILYCLYIQSPQCPSSYILSQIITNPNCKLGPAIPHRCSILMLISQLFDGFDNALIETYSLKYWSIAGAVDHQENLVVVVNDTTRLTCEKFPSVVWHFVPFDDPSQKFTVYSAGNIKQWFNGSIFIVNNTIEITRTKLEYAGVYECFRSFNDVHEVQLTVLGKFDL